MKFGRPLVPGAPRIRPEHPGLVDRLRILAAGAVVQSCRIGWIRLRLSRWTIAKYAGTTPPRPRPLSLYADYTTWESLNDRTYSGRHLPPTHIPESELPSRAEVVELFRRHEETPSEDSSVTFAFFAQWFTDSFLRTDRKDPRRNTSNHGIDLCQIYGLTRATTDLLRAHTGGLLESQILDGNEFPPFLFEPREPGGPLVVRERFRGLHDTDLLTRVLLYGTPDDRKDYVFAVGLENGNSTIGHTILNTVMVREHNRIARILGSENPEWDDDRLFETTRNIMITLLLKIVVEDYIKHIGPYDFPLQLVPFVADDARWNRENWISVEFNLLYRWHSLVPDEIGEGDDRLATVDFTNNNPLVIDRGVEELLTRCSHDPAGRMALFNVPDFLVDPVVPGQPGVTERTVALARDVGLAPYNDYRVAFGMKPVRSFRALTGDTEVADRLEALYGDVDRLDWLVGIFAERHKPSAMMGELMGRMVAYDAFTQALTNPLLSRNVFDDRTFTATGLGIIAATSSLEDIVRRNSAHPERVVASFTRR